MDIVIRAAVEADVPEITAIQNALIASSTVEWTDEPHTIADRTAWLRRQAEAGHPVLVAVSEVDRVVGWTSYGDFRDTRRWPGYRHTVEHTVHVDPEWWGRGVGRALVRALVVHARAAGRHVVVAGVDSANTASIEFHERMGFTVVGRMPEVGRMHGRWLDLVLMQRVISSADPPDELVAEERS